MGTREHTGHTSDGGSAAAWPALLALVIGEQASDRSSVAQALAGRLGAVCMAGEAASEELLRRAEPALASARPLVLDACMPRNAERLAARALARRRGAAFLLVECLASPPQLPTPLRERWEPVALLAPDEHVQVSGQGDVSARVSALLARPELRRLRPHARDAASAPRPAAVTFDCWNTLLREADWQSARALRIAELQAAAREAGRDVSAEAAQRAFDAAWDHHLGLWRDGLASGALEVAQWALSELGLREAHLALEHLLSRFEEASHSSRVEALAGARETLLALGRAGIPCALVCDTGLTPGRVVRSHLRRLELLDGLAVQVFSDEAGVPKPDPRVFRAALAPLGVSPERALHVGDLRRTDVAGGRALGMATVRICDPHDDQSELPEADHVVRSHVELRALLALDTFGG